jgi:hypothetical protein
MGDSSLGLVYQSGRPCIVPWIGRTPGIRAMTQRDLNA